MADRDYWLETHDNEWGVVLIEDGKECCTEVFSNLDNALATATVWISEVDDDE